MRGSSECIAPSQVIRGYVGDRSAEPIFAGTQLGRAFDTLGGGYQRPFELATLRLQNMAGILPKCASLPAGAFPNASQGCNGTASAAASVLLVCKQPLTDGQSCECAGWKDLRTVSNGAGAVVRRVGAEPQRRASADAAGRGTGAARH